MKKKIEKKFTEKRKKTRQVHVINEKSSRRDIEIAKADLTNFFLDSLNKHHGF